MENNNNPVREIKYKGLWTPKYLAEWILFPMPSSIQTTEAMLSSWACEIIYENTSDIQKQLSEAKEENAEYRERLGENVRCIESMQFHNSELERRFAESTKLFREERDSIKDKADKLASAYKNCITVMRSIEENMIDLVLCEIIDKELKFGEFVLSEYKGGDNAGK